MYGWMDGIGCLTHAMPKMACQKSIINHSINVKILIDVEFNSTSILMCV